MSDIGQLRGLPARHKLRSKSAEWDRRHNEIGALLALVDEYGLSHKPFCEAKGRLLYKKSLCTCGLTEAMEALNHE